MKWFLLLITTALLTGCQKPALQDPASKTVVVQEPLSRVNIIDHSGLSETITNKERLKELSQRNFLSSQPYRKVMRVYAHNAEGTSVSIITSYYENGQIRQYLECINGRACGLYQEWHPNGQKKLMARLLAGQADIDEKAFSTWSFDGVCTAWDDQGSKTATFSYQHGLLHGPSETFYPTGELERSTPYENGLKEGLETTYSKTGTILEQISYHNNVRHGPAFGTFSNGKEAWKEEFGDDLLISASYSSPSGTPLSSVEQGEGVRSLFEDDHLISQEEIHHGRPEGWTTLFEYDGTIERKYQVKNGKKHGTEIRYYLDSSAGTPRLSIEWREGLIHGTVKTWYPNGSIESQREMCQNMKQGVSMAWYPDGTVMLVEEYNEDKLIRGRYHGRGETTAFSTVDKGSGIATLFDSSGSVVEKVRYSEGKPQVN